MAISKNKIGVLINMDKELKEKLQKQAELENRSLTNLINHILYEYINNIVKKNAF